MRRRTAKKHIILPDPKFKDVEVTKFVNILMIDGKKPLKILPLQLKLRVDVSVVQLFKFQLL